MLNFATAAEFWNTRAAALNERSVSRLLISCMRGTMLSVRTVLHHSQLIRMKIRNAVRISSLRLLSVTVQGIKQVKLQNQQ